MKEDEVPRVGKILKASRSGGQRLAGSHRPLAGPHARVMIVAPLLFLALPHLQILAFASALLVVRAP